MRLPARVILLALTVWLTIDNEASARTSRRAHRPAVRPPSSLPSISSPAVDQAVSCSCASTASCPEIGALAIDGYRPQTLYCNQLNGVENPGVRTATSWTYQCAELANRWLVGSVGAPRIEGNADQMCDNADRSAYEVHTARAAYKPVPGDLLVWTGYRMGHVGVVMSVTSSSIVFANQNYGKAGVQYPVLAAPRTAGFFGSPRADRGLRAQCIIHPKKLTRTPADPDPSPPRMTFTDRCAQVPSAQNGAYCGASRQSGFAGGEAAVLYTCHEGRTTSLLRCGGTCTLEPVGRADHCS